MQCAGVAYSARRIVEPFLNEEQHARRLVDMPKRKVDHAKRCSRKQWQKYNERNGNTKKSITKIRL